MANFNFQDPPGSMRLPAGHQHLNTIRGSEAMDEPSNTPAVLDGTWKSWACMTTNASNGADVLTLAKGICQACRHASQKLDVGNCQTQLETQDLTAMSLVSTRGSQCGKLAGSSLFRCFRHLQVGWRDLPLEEKEPPELTLRMRK